MSIGRMAAVAAVIGGLLASVSVEPPHAGASSCTIKGTEGDDEITGTEGDDVICAFGGNDVIHALGGDDIVYGGPGNDIVYGGPGNDGVFGKSGDDTVYGGPGDDVVGGSSGNDELFGDDGDDILHGDEGDDILHGNAGSDRIAGGPGDDRLYAFDSTDIDGDEERNLLGGGSGWDALFGSAGDDILLIGTDGGVAHGGPGNDRLIGPTGSRLSDNHVVMFGGPGDDLLIANQAGSGSGRDIPGFAIAQTSDQVASYFSGGGGTDRVYASPFDDFVENAIGFVDAREGNDTLLLVGGIVLAGEGDDYVTGSDTNDELVGGPGDDQLAGGNGFDILRGGPGVDRLGGLDFNTSDGDNAIWSGTDDDQDTVWAVASDRCHAEPEDQVHGLCTP